MCLKSPLLPGQDAWLWWVGRVAVLLLTAHILVWPVTEGVSEAGTALMDVGLCPFLL